MLGRVDLRTALRRANGVTRTGLLLRTGITRTELRSAFANGAVIRPRRGWVALPSADPELLAAARRGAVVSCISQARRLGLWVLAASDAPHYAAPRPDSHIVAGPGTVHWRAPPLPRPPEMLEDHPENVLALVAECQPHEAALAIIDSALNQRIASLPALERLRIPRLDDLLSEASPFADSGLETLFRTRLGWLRIAIRAQVHLLGHRVDFLLGERLVVQIDGKQHSGVQRDADILHDARLRAEGYTVIRVTYALVVHRWEDVQSLVLSAVARGLHLRRAH